MARRMVDHVMAAALATSMMTATALANDSMAEVAIGGLVLTESDSIAMDKEDLFISREEVRVDYVFTNTSDKDVETLVAFPLPDQNYADESGAAYDLGSSLKFQTTVDGKSVDYQIVEQVMLGEKDVTEKLLSYGLKPHIAQEWEAFSAKMKTLSPDQLKEIIALGLVDSFGTPEESAFQPLWQVRTSVTRTQLFPAGKSIAVSHRYNPIEGGSVGGALNAEYRNEDWQKQQAKTYCIEDSWFAAFDKAIAGRATADNPFPYSEWWLGYVLSSGANWKGPIKDFRLVIDKGKPENLVSFCAEGVTKIAPTQFEVRKSNYEPKSDLKILIVEWIDAAQ